MVNAMQYYRELYLSDTLCEKKEKIIWRLEHNKIQLHIYLIVLAVRGKNQLEFFDAAMLRQKEFSPQKEECRVIGIADGYEEAVGLVAQITADVLEKTGGIELREYFMERMQADEMTE